jgi:mRNA interferase MazF
MSYVPDRGDIVWINFDPRTGHEQSGQRPALILSPVVYNRRAKLALVCPITSQVKGYPFEVVLPDKLDVSGVILSDHIRSVDWLARNAVYVCKVPENVLEEVLAKLDTLLNP